MKKKFLVLMAVLLVSTVTLSGGMDVNIKGDSRGNHMDEDFNFEGSGNFVGNGGPMVGAVMMDLAPLNTKLKAANLPELTGNEYEDYNVMLVLGGGGIGGTFKNSFGGYGASGKISNSSGNKKVSLAIEYGGFVYEKGIIKIDTTNTRVSLGFLAGGGTSTLSIIYDDIENDFGNVVKTPHTNIFTKEYLVFAPRLNIHQKIGAFIGVDLSAEYQMNFDMGETWKLDDEEVEGPLSNTQSPVLGARLSFGF